MKDPIGNKSQVITDDVQKFYREYDINLRKKRLKIAVPLAILFVMIFALLDLVVYPMEAKQLIIYRIATDILLAFIFLVLCKKKSYNIKFISILVVILILILINVLIFLTKGSSSPYYAGLTLTIVAMSALLPWTFYESLFLCSVTLFLYLLMSLIYFKYKEPSYEISLIANNLFFLFSTNVFCVVASTLNSKLRFQEFFLNYQLKSTIGQLKSTQIQLIQSEKINALGSLSAGLLHEINNPLNYTMTAINMVKDDPHIKQDADLKEIVGDIEEGMNRIKRIIGDLRAFAYPSEADKQMQFPIYEAVEVSLRFTAHDLHDIKIINQVDNKLNVTASKTHIVQILINLITNATKAINKSDHSGLIVMDAKKENNRIVVSVADNGAGMDEETLQKIFDPFFTTAEVGNGVGLGLSICHTIAKTHGGNLYATSELGQGSVFYFDLPA
jgi:two-component system, sensor histidine kinase PhcS